MRRNPAREREEKHSREMAQYRQTIIYIVVIFVILIIIRTLITMDMHERAKQSMEAQAMSKD